MDYSFGVIPLRYVEGEWHCLLVQHKQEGQRPGGHGPWGHGPWGHWAFPKGHPLPQESALETAQRELAEETGLSIVEWLPLAPFTETYSFTYEGRIIDKQVAYFAAVVTGEVTIQPDEISQSRWVRLAEADAVATFPQAKAMITQLGPLLPEQGPQSG